MPWKIKWSPALNANTETLDTSRSITGVTKLNNFECSTAESINRRRAYCIDCRQVEKQLNRKSLLHIVIKRCPTRSRSGCNVNRIWENLKFSFDTYWGDILLDGRGREPRVKSVNLPCLIEKSDSEPLVEGLQIVPTLYPNRPLCYSNELKLLQWYYVALWTR